MLKEKSNKKENLTINFGPQHPAAHGEVEYGGDLIKINDGIYGVDYQKTHYLEGSHKKILDMANLSKNESYWFTYPTDQELKQLNIKITHWSFYENWDPYRNYEYAKKYIN